MQDVADAAGVSKQALLHHFASKDLLRTAVYDELALRIRALFPEVAGELVSRSRDRYRALIELVLRRFVENPLVARFLVFELLEHQASVIAWLREELSPWLGLIRGVVQQTRGGPKLDVEAHVAVLASMMLTQAALVPGDTRWKRRTAAASLAIMLRGSHLAPR